MDSRQTATDDRSAYDPRRHELNCDFHVDQYLHECTCGLRPENTIVITRPSMTLRDLRLNTGKTQKQVASAMGVSVRTVQRLERSNDPLVGSMVSFVKALGGELFARVTIAGETFEVTDLN